MVACGAALVFGGEINEFVRRIIMLVLVVAFITGVVNVASALGITGSGRVSLRRLPFHRVLHRPNLFLGGEREPALLTLLVAGGLAVSGMNTVSFLVGAALWFSAIPVLRWMAKADPQMTKIYVRHIRYRGYYPARSRPYRTE